MIDQVIVAAASLPSQCGQWQSNVEQMEQWAACAAAQSARLLLFPELSLTGFIPNHPRGEHEPWLREALAAARSVAQPLDGPAVAALARVAGRHDVLLSAGMLEDAGNLLYNTQVLVGPAGLLGHWRKMHVPMFEAPFYNGGGIPEVVDTPLGRIGVNICFDAFLPESTRLLASRNVEIVLFPFAADPPPCTPQGWSAWAAHVLRVRCSENGVFGLAANYVGRVECAGVEQTFPGGGLAFGPRGELLAEWPTDQNEPAMMLARFDAETLRTARAEPEYTYRFRRPELYGRLCQ
ncbi:MAG: carbon-nitrogen hydrolase family protein [Pirellulales bacterium]|nr:carbon-nitrogen hydrolase family protein [Planctomycetales bacterium]